MRETPFATTSAPLVSPPYRTLTVSASLLELLKGVVSLSTAARSLEGVGDSSARRALNNRERGEKYKE